MFKAICHFSRQSFYPKLKITSRRSDQGRKKGKKVQRKHPVALSLSPPPNACALEASLKVASTDGAVARKWVNGECRPPSALRLHARALDLDEMSIGERGFRSGATKPAAALLLHLHLCRPNALSKRFFRSRPGRRKERRIFPAWKSTPTSFARVNESFCFSGRCIHYANRSVMNQSVRNKGKKDFSLSKSLKWIILQSES